MIAPIYRTIAEDVVRAALRPGEPRRERAADVVQGAPQVLGGADVNSSGNLSKFDVTIFGRGSSFTYLGDICEIILSRVSVPDAEIDRRISYMRAGWTGATVVL